MNGDLLEAALDYARRGWPVFPCDKSKRPLTPHGFRDATLDERVIRSWWRKWPNALIGVPMGRPSGVFAIDVDGRGKPGHERSLESWLDLVNRNGCPSTHKHETPSGGLHVVFVWDPDRPVTNSPGSLPDKIEVRGEGGYIICPPSVIDGHKYHHADPLDFFDFADAPSWIYEFLEPKAYETPAPREPKSSVEREQDRTRTWASTALARISNELSQESEGNRNNALNGASFRLGRMVGSGFLDQGEVETALEAAAEKNGLVLSDGRGRVRATIASGMKAGIANPSDGPRNRNERRANHREKRSDEARPHANDIVTEDNAAQRFAELFEGKLRYCHDTGAWFRWTGSIWARDCTGLAFQWARELARHLAETEGAKARFILSKTSFASGVERFCRSDPVFAVTAERWDRDPWLLGTPGGTVDLRTGQLRAADPADGITKSTAVTPSHSADCPRFLRFLDETTGGDTAFIRFLQQWCGYSLTGVTREHALVFIYGGGGEGKSTFINVIIIVIGDYAVTAPMDTFIAAHGDRHPTDLAMLRGARLVTASETEDGRQWAEARIKQLTGGDPISARFMRQDFFTFTPAFKLTIIGNHRPSLRNVDEAAKRRVNIVPFTIKPVQPDPTLDEKLKAEGPGILRWMIDGCLDWQTNGLLRPEKVTKATEDYFGEQDLFKQWLEEECDVEPANPHKFEATGALFKSWSEYATKAGERPGSIKSFSGMMQRHGLSRGTTDRGATRTYRGVRLNSSFQNLGDDR
jgi:putative DNA primase/helicase